MKRRAKRQLGPLGRSTTADGTSGPGPRLSAHRPLPTTGTHCPGGSPDTHEDFSQEQGSNGRPRVCGLQAAGAEAAEQSTSNLVVHGPLSTVHAIVLAQSGLERLFLASATLPSRPFHRPPLQYVQNSKWHGARGLPYDDRQLDLTHSHERRISSPGPRKIFWLAALPATSLYPL